MLGSGYTAVCAFPVGPQNRPQFLEQDTEALEIDQEASSVNVDKGFDHFDS